MMKKILGLLLIAALVLTGCTENARARKWGGTMTIKLEKGEKLLEATWKENSLFYLTEPMEEDYEPKQKIFREDSPLGIVESKVIFIESR